MPKAITLQWNALSPLLDKALDLEDEERATWISTQDPELAGQLGTLLREHSALAQEGFLENRPVDMPTVASALTGQRLGVYTLVSQIGQGGMGSVWLAERNDGRFERRVAVKFLNIALMGKAGEERFKREGKILGLLAHPNIADLIDAGVTKAGQPYLVLEYIEGDRIDYYCDHKQFDIPTRIRLFLDVLGAVALAHANLIVHRDLKPSNVLVRIDDQVKLLDFGIAKLLEDGGDAERATQLTFDGARAMTPEYAAPEQLKGEAVATGTDVYALGVLLYVLLTGRHPHRTESVSAVELIKAVVDIEPAHPSDIFSTSRESVEVLASIAANRATTPDKLRRMLRGDLDTILMKALKKEPGDRYLSVTAMAEDLRRYLKNQPIGARPDTLAYRVAKFVRRHRTAMTLATLAIAATAAGVVGTVIQSRTARRERDSALRQLARAERTADLNELLLSDVAPMGKPLGVNQLLEREEHVIEREHNPDAANHVELLLSLGDQYSGEDDNAKALRVINEAYQISRNLREPSIRAKASCVLAGALVPAEELARAELLFQEGLRELGSAPQFATNRAFCLLRGSEVAYRNGKSVEAIARARAAEQTISQSPNKWNLLELNVLTNLAGVLGDSGQFRESNGAFERAYALMTSLGYDDTQKAVKLFNDWALILNYSGRQLDAERIYRRALDISRIDETDTAIQPALLLNYARALHELGRSAEAADYTERAYARARQAGDQMILDQADSLKARLYIDGHDFSRANELLNQLEPKLRKKFPPEHYVFSILASERSQLALGTWDIPAALLFANQAVELDEASMRKIGQCASLLPTFLVRRSKVELQAGRTDWAMVDANKALELLQAETQSGRHSSNVGRAYMALALSLSAQGKASEAKAASRIALENLQDTLGPDHPDTRGALKLAEVRYPSHP